MFHILKIFGNVKMGFISRKGSRKTIDDVLNPLDPTTARRYRNHRLDNSLKELFTAPTRGIFLPHEKNSFPREAVVVIKQLYK